MTMCLRKFQAVVETTELRTNFAGDLAALSNTIMSISDFEDWAWGWKRPQSIVLLFRQQNPTVLSLLRFNAVPLIEATKDYGEDTHINVELVYSNASPSVSQSFIADLQDIKGAALVALITVFQKEPLDENWPYPAIWVDGLGRVREITINTPNAYQGGTFKGSENVGQTTIRNLAADIRDNHKSKLHHKQDYHLSVLKREVGKTTQLMLLLDVLLESERYES